MALSADDLHGLLLIKDVVDSDAGFLVAHLLKLMLGLEGRHAVVLVACKHTMPHYAAVMRKLGVNLGAAAAAGRLVALDALRPSRDRPHQLMDLKVLFGAIEGACAEAAAAAGGAPVALVFDDLTVSTHVN
jgi:KaiC/GvpD/RAD55 family RecA-like ATPase